MTDSKKLGAPAPENADKNKEEVFENQGAGITVSGISGTKTLRVGRVNKRPKPSSDAESASSGALDAVGSLQSEGSEQKPAPQEAQENASQEAFPKKISSPSQHIEEAQSEKTERVTPAHTSPRSESEPETAKPSVSVSATVAVEQSSVAEPSVENTDKGTVSTSPSATPAQPTRTTSEYTPRPSSDSGYQGNRPTGQGGYQGNRPAGQGGYQGNRPMGEGSGYQGNRPAGQGGYQGNRPMGEGSGYQGNRPAGQGGYQGNRPMGEGSGYQGNRPAGQGGYQGNRPMGEGSGYQGNRPAGQGGYQGGYQGNRPMGEGSGYQGNRPAGQGGYQGNRPMGEGSGYQGNRPAGQGGYQGNRPMGEGSGYQGNRPAGQGGYQGSRPTGGPGGGYNNGRPQGGGYGAGRSRDDSFGKAKDEGFVRSKEDNGYGSKNQSRTGSKGPAKSGSDIPAEITKEKANFAARDAFEKSRKDPAKDTKKDAGKAVVAQGDRRASNIRAATAAFSGRGASEILSDDSALDNLYPMGSKGKRVPKKKPFVPAMPPIPKAVLSHVSLPEYITIKEFSDGIQKRSADVIKKLMKLGLLATINQEIDFDTATIVAAEFGITTQRIVEVTEEDILFDDTEDTDENLETRPPVVVVMGHVDHGKTSLLDKIRSTSVVKGEAGGITQHIGAYTVRLKSGRQITFLDTPGHEAFTTMRARGAQVTDIAILVVAADDGVMPQTIEAINHAKAANTEIVVAINKMDKPGANVEKVKQELSLHGVIPEEWGGTNVMVPVSAKTGDGIDDLLEMVLLTADVLDLRADPNKQAKGTVIEAKLDKSRGPVATVLVQRGTLRSGDTVVTGSIVGRVRAMSDDKGAVVKKAGPSIPVEILGLPEVPDAGEIFYAVTDEKVARQLVEKRRVKQREDQLRKSSRMTLETLSQTLAAGEVKDLNLIVKADVQGSVEAVIQSLEKLSSDEVHVKIIHGAVGAITESDIVLADVSNAIIIGFNVRPATNIADKAKEVGVDIKLYRVIYSAIEDVQAAMKGLLKPTFEEVIIGHVEIRQTFKVSNIGTVGGAYVTDGKVFRSSEIRVVRDGIVIHEGKLASLKRFKDDAREVAAGYECGISIDGFNDIKEGDIIEAFEMKEIERK